MKKMLLISFSIMMLLMVGCGEEENPIKEDEQKDTNDTFFVYDTIKEDSHSKDTVFKENIIVKKDTIFSVVFDTIFKADTIFDVKTDTLFKIAVDTVFQGDTIYKVIIDTIFKKDTIFQKDTVFIKDSTVSPENPTKDPQTGIYDWDDTPIPTELLAKQANWTLNTEVSDDFNYTFAEKNTKTYFGPNGEQKWYNFYHNTWDGPGATVWRHDHVSVSDGHLKIKVSRQAGEKKNSFTATRTGCFTSAKRIPYPAFVETKIKLSRLSLASCLWMLSPDDAQEIDILKAYGGVPWFKQFLHLSHHYFDRDPFTDYQPKDWGSWYGEQGKSDWLNEYITIGVYWKSPQHLEYYVNGKHVRTLSDKAIAYIDKTGKWVYGYYTLQGGKIKETGGYFDITPATSLADAQAKGTVNVIDPYNYMSLESKHENKPGLWKDMDLIINVEDQDWHAANGNSPSDAEIVAEKNNPFMVDWVRIYHPKN